MKKVLIAGADSYIGNSLERWLGQWPDRYLVQTVDTKGGVWERADFSRADAVIYVAGAVHVKETKKNRALFFEVNRDLAEAVARKSKEAGVGLFVFISTMSVYGIEDGIITQRTLVAPKTAYGRSKLEGEEQVNRLSGPGFRVAILRPPMVYGPGCKGNYPRLSKWVQKIPIFPLIHNERSMIYIDYLSEFIRHVVDANAGGLFFPQNSKPVETSDFAVRIARAQGRTVRLTRFFNPLIMVARHRIVRKVFGTLVYEPALSASPGGDYQTCSFVESIEAAEKGMQAERDKK